MHGAITLLEIKIKNLPQIEKLICQLMHGAITVLEKIKNCPQIEKLLL